MKKLFSWIMSFFIKQKPEQQTYGRMVPIPPGNKKPHLQPDTENTTDNNSEGDFVTSAVVGMATNNALLGTLVGGSLTGGLVGDFLNDEHVDGLGSSIDSFESSDSFDDD